MNYSFEYIDIILLAMIAGFIFLRLRGILGRRSGFDGKSPHEFQEVLKKILTHPNVRKALPGEFSQRAVLNGRLSLTQAEAISELIGARSQKAAQLAIAGMDGGVQLRITTLRDKHHLAL